MFKTKLSGRNKIMAINTWAVAILRYSAGVIKWKSDDRAQSLFLALGALVLPGVNF